jgi:hypothetical protein
MSVGVAFGIEFDSIENSPAICGPLRQYSKDSQISAVFLIFFRNRGWKSQVFVCASDKKSRIWILDSGFQTQLDRAVSKIQSNTSVGAIDGGNESTLEVSASTVLINHDHVVQTFSERTNQFKATFFRAE